MKIRKYIPIIIVSILLVLSIGISLYYTFLDQESLTLDNVSISDTKREEIQRYFGYEPLLSRYLTLPYDVSINTNQQGSFVDVGFIYILFLPLLLLAFIKRDFLKWIVMLVLFLLLTISVKNSFIFADNSRIDAANVSDIYAFPNYDFIDSILIPIYTTLNAVYAVVNPVIDLLSGDQDYITYPIIISGFLFILYLLYLNTIKSPKRETSLIILACVYGFFFFTFSSGIIWYGYLFFLLSMLGILYYLSKIEQEQDSYSIFIKTSFSVLISLWLIIGTVSKISNIQIKMSPQHQGKAIISPDVYQYNTGNIRSLSEIQDKYITPGFSEAMKKINADNNTKVFKIGTGLTYFIDQNHKRVIYDNQLGLFSQIVKNYKNKYVISDLLKSSNIKFLIIDLNTPSIDNTPERTLTRKYLQLMEYVKENDSLKLICTDNLVRSEGTNSTKYALEGETVRPGNFAIYEIH